MSTYEDDILRHRTRTTDQNALAERWCLANDPAPDDVLEMLELGRWSA